MHTVIYNTFLEGYNNMQMFALCNEFNDLSLYDSGFSSSSTSQVHSSSTCQVTKNLVMSYSYCQCFLQSCKLKYPSCRSHLRAPFLEIHRNFLESFPFESEKQRINFCFRFLPPGGQFIHDVLELPKAFDSMSILSLGLRLHKNVLSPEFLTLNRSMLGLRGLVNNNVSKHIVEVLTFSQGFYWRFLVLVYLGVGCTVWYALAAHGNHLIGSFAPFESYDPFYHMGYNAPGFHKMTFVDSTDDVSALVDSALRDENNPFSGITIPANGPVLQAVGLGLMVAILLSVEIVPDMSSEVIGVL